MAHPHLVVGAGPSGLATARAFRLLDMPVEVVERHDDVGGIWDQSNPGSPVYDSAHFISSRTMSGFQGFPMPDDYPDYPSHRQVLAYVRSFAEAYGLYDHVRLSTSVDGATWQDGAWQVSLSDGSQRTYAGIVCANGTEWEPSMPDLPGDFDGQVLHSRDYRSPVAFAGQRVLVVGAGNSAVDIVGDAVRVADTTLMSVRRGYHVIPKHLFGVPADVIAHSGPQLPMRFNQWLFPKLMRVLQGDPTRHGWPAPDHRIFETHPLVSSQLVSLLAHGDVQVRPGIDHADGDSIVFTDGSREQVDVVVMATGYRSPIPYLPADTFDWRGDRPQGHLHVFSRQHDHAFAVGFAEIDGAGYPIYDLMGQVVAQAAHTQATDPAGAARLRERIAGPTPDLSGGVRHVNSDRHVNYLDGHAYGKAIKALRRHLGWTEIRGEDFDRLRVDQARTVAV